MRLTLFLIIANLAVFFVILKLEFSDNVIERTQRPLVEISRLEVNGKNLAKSRIVVLDNNKWKIISPIKWEANTFAVNRILNNLKFLDEEIGFDAQDLELRGQSLADYGLDDPICTFKYGNDKVMYSLKIGNSASVGEKVYMLDSLEDRVIVADRQLADSLMVDIDRLRSQNVISIPKFEISSIALRLPVKDLNTQAKATWRRVGLTKNLEGSWAFEAPFVADASNKAVEAFLSAVTSAYIKSFDELGELEAGLDTLSFPINITLDSTNKSQTLFLGNMNKETHSVYAKLSDNPTIFTLDSTAFESLESLQEDLRSRDIMTFSAHSCNNIEISSGESMLNLKKLSDDTWDISGRVGTKLSEVSTADLSVVNSLLASLNNTIARAFISDMKNEDLARYGLAKPKLKFALSFDNSAKKTLLIGDAFKQGAVTLYYAKLEDEDSIYAISGELINKYKVNAMDYKSKLLYSLPENSKLMSIDVVDLMTKELVLEAKAVDGSFAEYVATKSNKDKELFATLLNYSKTLYAKNYVQGSFDDMLCSVNGEKYPWAYELRITISMRGTGGDEELKESILLTDRLGANLQYALYKGKIFELAEPMINALYFLGVSATPIPDKQ